MSTLFLKFLTIILIIGQVNIYAQETSQAFKNIKENSILSTEEKLIKFDSLINKHITNENYNYLLGDRFELIKWIDKKGNTEKAIELNTKNIALIDSLKTIEESFYRRNLYSLGFYQKKIKDYKNATKSFNKFVAIDSIDIYSHIAYYFIAHRTYLSGDYYLAAKQHEFASKIAKKYKNHKYYLKNSLEASSALKVLNTPKSLQKGIKILKEAEDYIMNNKNINLYYSFYVYNKLGDLYNDREDFDFEKSILYYNKALKIANTINDTVILADIYNNLGLIYLKANKKEALNYLKKGLSYNSSYYKTYTYRHISTYYLNNKSKTLALKNIQESINNIAPFNHETLESLPTKETLLASSEKNQIISGLLKKAEIMLELANVAPFKKNSNQYALEALKLADYLVDVIRLKSSEQNSKLYWRDTANEIYVNATKACFRLNLPDEAFNFIEKNKAVLLLEDVNRKQLLEHTTIPKKISKRQIKLKNNIKKLNSSISINTLDSEKQLLVAKQNYNIFIDSLQGKYKRFYKVQEPTSVIALKDLKTTIKDQEVFLQYILDNNSGFIQLISKNNTSLFKIKDLSKLDIITKQYRSLLEQPLKNNEDLISLNKISLELYNILIPKQIQSDLKNKILTIIPDSYLQNIPFEVLQTSEKTNSFLLYKNEINYAYSISFLKENNNIIRNNDKSFIGFAPIEFTNGLTQLPRSKKELKKISKLFNSRLFLNKEASKNNFSSNIKNYDIIHVASHANANDSISPWIAFSDDKINLEELYNIDNTAELVVLSACKTSLGEISEGEGVMSLARGFFNTGANSVISSLWNVNDKSNTEITTSFYRYLKDGETKSASLRQAKLDYLQTHSLSEASPYYWSSLILIGDNSTIKLKDNNLFYIILTILIFLFLFFILKKTL